MTSSEMQIKNLTSRIQTLTNELNISIQGMKKEERKEKTKHHLLQKPLHVGDKVRLRILKNLLSKYSEPNFSTEIHTIARVLPAKATKATKYVLTAIPNKKWVAENLIKIEGDETNEAIIKQTRARNEPKKNRTSSRIIYNTTLKEIKKADEEKVARRKSTRK